MVFDGSQAQSKIKLIASTVAQSLDLHLFSVLSNRDQDRFVIIAKTGGQATMIPEGKTRKQLTRTAQNRVPDVSRDMIQSRAGAPLMRVAAEDTVRLLDEPAQLRLRLSGPEV